MTKQFDGDVDMTTGAGNFQGSERSEDMLDIVKKCEIEDIETAM